MHGALGFLLEAYVPATQLAWSLLIQEAFTESDHRYYKFFIYDV